MENIFDWNCPARKRACGADLGEGDAVGNGTGGNAVENGTGGNAGRKWDRRKCGSEMGPSEVRAGMGSCGNAGRKWDRRKCGPEWDRAAMRAGNGTGGNAVGNGTGGNAGRKWDRAAMQAGNRTGGSAGRKWGAGRKSPAETGRPRGANEAPDCRGLLDDWSLKGACRTAPYHRPPLRRTRWRRTAYSR